MLINYIHTEQVCNDEGNIPSTGRCQLHYQFNEKRFSVAGSLPLQAARSGPWISIQIKVPVERGSCKVNIFKEVLHFYLLLAEKIWRYFWKYLTISLS